jgi:hypothetical protein
MVGFDKINSELFLTNWTCIRKLTGQNNLRDNVLFGGDNDLAQGGLKI